MIRRTNGCIEEYKRMIDSGEVVVGHEMKQIINNLLEDMNDDRFIYDTTDAEKRIDFIQGALRLSKSPFFSKPFNLMPFQKAFISAVYGFYMASDETQRFRRIIFLIGRKNGKLLDLNTPIETPSGRKRFGDIHEGDYVFGHDGKPVRVLWESPIQYNSTFEVVFEDGERIIAGGNHNWAVTNKHWRRLLKYEIKGTRKTPSRDEFVFDAYKVMTTRELYNYGLYLNRSDGKGREYHWRVPMMSAPVVYNEQPPVWKPYFVGYWLGNGNRTQPSLSCHSQDADELREYLDDGDLSQFHLYGKDKSPNAFYMSFKNRLVIMRQMNLINNKHIPEEYFTASVEERLEFIKGFMDADGTVGQNGECAIMQKDKNLIDGIGRILSSLGIKWSIHTKEAKIYGKSYGDVYRINFFVDKEHTVFKLKRKTARLKDKLSPRMKDKTIVDIRLVDMVPMKCIAVDDEKHLFAVGERNTLTHNSELSSALLLTDFFIGGRGMDIVCSSNDDNQADILYQACDTMRQLVDPESLDSWRNQKGLRCLVNNNKMFKISERIRAREGRNIDTACFDEAHELKEGSIIKAIEQSQSLKINPKFIVLSTEGFVQDGWLSKELIRCRQILNHEIEDEASIRTLPFLYTQDSTEEVWMGNRENRLWMKSNPTLGVVKRYDYLEQQIALAKQSKEDRAFVLTKDFNIPQLTSEAWLMSEDFSYDWQPFDPSEFHNAVAVGGVDLSETTDLSSAKVILRRPNDPNKYLLSMYWIPEPKLDPKNNDQNAGARYADWQRDGLIRVDAGKNYINTTLVADWFYELYQKYHIRLYKCGYDVKFSQEFTDRMDDYGFDYEMVYQRPEVMSLPNKMVETDLKHRQIIGLNTVDRWCLSNCALKLDAKGYGLVVKIDGQDSRRIDGAVSLIIAYEMYRRYQSDIERYLQGVKQSV